MMTNAMLTVKKFVLICVYIIVNYQCSINAGVIKRENYDLHKHQNLVSPIYQKITGKTLREYPLLGYKIKKCLTHYYKNLRKPKEHFQNSKEIGRFPKKDSYIIQQNANLPREQSVSAIKIANKHDANIPIQFLKVPEEKQLDIKSEEMEMDGEISKFSAENLFDAIIVGEPIIVDSAEDPEIYDGIIVGESEEEDYETPIPPIMKYSGKVKPHRRMIPFDSDTQPEEFTYTIKVFADENKQNKMMANVIEKLLREIALDDFLKIVIDYMRTHNDEITFNELSEILSKRKGSGTKKLPCVSKELRRQLKELGNTRLPYIYFDLPDDMDSENTEEKNRV